MITFDEDKIGVLLSETARAWRTRLDQRLKPLGLSQGKWITLLHLAKSEENLTQTELAARVGVEEPTMAGLLSRLQSARWIKRESSRHDRRCKIVHLQPRARAILNRILSTAHDLRQELIRDVPMRDLQACMRVLAHIRDTADSVPRKNGASRNGTGFRKKT